MASYIRTYTGKEFYPLAPVVADIDIADIAHALSMVCRFTGHVKEFYSVAQHSVHVSHFCAPADALWGLLHDASEAYIADVSRPVKQTPEMFPYRSIEKTLMNAVCARFGLEIFEPESVKLADKRMLQTEGHVLMRDFPLHDGITTLPFALSSWSPATAEATFLKRFRELSDL